MEDPLFDFARYLALRLGIGEDETNVLLSRWLKEYEPVSCCSRDQPSGVSPTADAVDTPNAEHLQKLG